MFSWVTTTGCAQTLFVLSSFVSTDQHLRVPPKFFMAIGDSFSRVELATGNRDGGEAAALHIASGDVQNAFHHMGIPEWLRLYFCLRPLSAPAFGMTGKNVQEVRVSTEQKVFPAPLTLPIVFSQSMFFCQHVGLQQASCADLPLSLPVITDGGPPIVNGPNHSVCFRWNCEDTFGAVSKGATLTDQCLDGPRESFRRAGLAVHTITPAALSAETLRMRTIPSHGVCGSAFFVLRRLCAF